MTHSDLPQILIDGHASLLAKLLTQNALTARCHHHKIYPAQRDFSGWPPSRVISLSSNVSLDVGGNESLCNDGVQQHHNCPNSNSAISLANGTC